MTVIEKLISIAENEIGYLEKQNADNLDDKTDNAGEANYTKYARDLKSYYNSKKQGVAWCATFSDWCFVQAFGESKSKAMQYQPSKSANNCACGCDSSMKYYKAKNAFYDYPEIGDRIYFASSSNPSASGHTGIVVAVSKSKVTTIEGNTSGASGVIPNGGGVCKKSYALTNDRILGYGRPKWELVSKDVIENGDDSTMSTVNYQAVVKAKTGSTVNFREKPSLTSSKVLERIPSGKTVQVIETDDANVWSRIEYDGKIGYMMSQFLVVANQNENDNDAVMEIITTIESNLEKLKEYIMRR